MSKFNVGDTVRRNAKGAEFEKRRAAEAPDAEVNFTGDATVLAVHEPDDLPAPAPILKAVYGFDDEDLAVKWYELYTGKGSTGTAAAPETMLEGVSNE